MKTYPLVIVLLFLSLIGCTTPVAISTLTPSNTAAPSPSAVPLTASPTLAPSLTPTLIPTSTPQPTPTVVPSPTPEFLWELGYLNFFIEKWGGDIFVSHKDGGQIINLTENLAGYKDIGSWSPDEQWILIGRHDAERVTHTGKISTSTPVESWLIKTDGTFQKMLFIGTGVSWTAWSGDSKYIFVNCPRGNFEDGICIISIDDEEIKVTHTNHNGHILSVTPDGENFLFETSFSTILYIINPKNLKTRSLALFSSSIFGRNIPVYVSNIVWSADGQSFDIFQSSSNKSILHNIKLDGGSPAILSEFEGEVVGNIYLSPDGSRIAFWFTPRDSIFTKFGVIDFDGSNLLLLDTKDVIENREPGNAAGLNPRDTWLGWTPDGQKVIIYYGPRPEAKYIVDLQTGSISRSN